MSRHVPAPDEQAAIDLLAARGYTVLRTKSYQHLLNRAQLAERQVAWEKENNASIHAWADRLGDDVRRLRDRCDDLVAFAYEHGATFEDLKAFNARSEAARERADAEARATVTQGAA